MKTLILAAAAASALAAGAPAMAQSFAATSHYDGRAYPGWQSINSRQANLDRRIDVGVRRGTLTQREAQRLRADFRGLQRLEARYRAGGLTDWERGDLDQRMNVLSARIRSERADRQRYG